MLKRGKGNKKGISPLIATVLIIGFVIALSVIFWAFFSKSVGEQASKQEIEAEGKSKCLGVEVAVSCDSNKNVIKVKNNGQEGVAGFTFRLGNEAKPPLYEPVEAGEDRDYEPEGINAGVSGSAIPIVSAKDAAYPCSDKVASFEC